MQIIKLSPIKPYHKQLCNLLIDSVESNASVGFLPPLSTDEADDYWLSVDRECYAENKVLLVATENNHVLGAVQLALNTKKNGSHRGEVEKLMVHSSARGKGTGKQLMLALEQHAIDLDKKLLVLDTREGDVASSLYKKLGYTVAGIIPDFALSSTGQLDGTVIFYKQI